MLQICTCMLSYIQTWLCKCRLSSVLAICMPCSAQPQQRAAVPKSASEDDVFSAIGGLEISGKRESDVAAASAAPQPAPGVPGRTHAAADAAAAAAVSGPIPSSHSAGSLGGGSRSSTAASPRGGGFAAGPSIGDLPQDEGPSRTLFIRNLDPGTAAAELQRAFEVRVSSQMLWTCMDLCGHACTADLMTSAAVYIG
jgi:hypothetical protein